MATDVATFTKQLREEGIEAARQEAEKIIAEAKARAQHIIDEAASSVKKMKHDAQEEIAQKVQRSEAEMKLVARDLILMVRKKIEEVAAALLAEKVTEALRSEEVVKDALKALLAQHPGSHDWEVKTGQALAKAAIEDLFKKAGARVKLAEGLQKAGFELRQKDGAQVIEVTDESVVAAFKRLLSPELGKLLEMRLESGK
jgi:V/A-type H+-transporting ATPase subunit E